MSRTIKDTYLSGALVDCATSVFQGYGNLPRIVPENNGFFLGVDIISPSYGAITFGDQMEGETLVFVAANCRPNADNSLSLLIYLEKSTFDTWLVCEEESSKAPTEGDWCIVQFSDWVKENQGAKQFKSCFSSPKEFTTGCSKFIKQLMEMKDNLDTGSGVYKSIFLMPPRNDVKVGEVSSSDASDDERGEADEEDNSTENEGGEKGEDNDDNEDGNEETEVAPKADDQKGKTKRSTDPIVNPPRKSSRVYVRTTYSKGLKDISNNGLEDLASGGFVMPPAPKGTGKGKQKGAGKGKQKGPQKTPTDNNKKLKVPVKKVPPKTPPVTTLTEPVMKTPATKSTPVKTWETPNNDSNTFDTFMSQQNKVLDYQNKFAGFLFGYSERYASGGKMRTGEVSASSAMDDSGAPPSSYPTSNQKTAASSVEKCQSTTTSPMVVADQGTPAAEVDKLQLAWDLLSNDTSWIVTSDKSAMLLDTFGFEKASDLAFLQPEDVKELKTKLKLIPARKFENYFSQ